MVDLKRFNTHYELEADYLDIPEVEVTIDRIGKALGCQACDSFDCPHILLIWNLPEEVNYLESLGFINIKNFRRN